MHHLIWGHEGFFLSKKTYIKNPFTQNQGFKNKIKQKQKTKQQQQQNKNKKAEKKNHCQKRQFLKEEGGNNFTHQRDLIKKRKKEKKITHLMSGKKTANKQKTTTTTLEGKKSDPNSMPPENRMVRLFIHLEYFFSMCDMINNSNGTHTQLYFCCDRLT